ncbi:unnamed protein product [Discosporangium mesarthrocarpum]
MYSAVQVLTPAQKAELLKRYKLKDTQLPRIQSSDPVARFYGMQARSSVPRLIPDHPTTVQYFM